MATLGSEELVSYLGAAREAARRGAAVLEEWRKRFKVREKGRFDLVTDADFASQKAIREYLNGRFPDHDFLGEEEPANAVRRVGPERRRPGSSIRSMARRIMFTTARSTASPSVCKWPGSWWPASS